MWWDVIPSLAIMSVCCAMPFIGVYATNKLFLGTPYKRYLERPLDAHLYLRDMRISGNNNAYNQKGLENLRSDDGTC